MRQEQCVSESRTFSRDLEECSHRLPAERLFQQLYIGTEVRILDDTSPHRIMKCDAYTEGTRTYIVLSGDTTMFPSFREFVPNELTVSAKGVR